MTGREEVTRPVGDECIATLGWALSVGRRWREVSAMPTGGWGVWLLSQAFGEAVRAGAGRWVRECDRALGFAAVLWGADEELIARWAQHPTRGEGFAEAAAFALEIRDRDAWAFAHARNAFWRVCERQRLGWPVSLPREVAAGARAGATLPDEPGPTRAGGARGRHRHPSTPVPSGGLPTTESEAVHTVVEHDVDTLLDLWDAGASSD